MKSRYNRRQGRRAPFDKSTGLFREKAVCLGKEVGGVFLFLKKSHLA